EDRACQAERHARAPAPEPDLDRALELARGEDGDPRRGQQAAPLQLAQLARILVGDALNDDPLSRPALAQRAVADRPDLAGQRWDGVAVRVELRASEEVEDALLHPLRDDVLEALGLVVHLVPAVAEHPHQEHLELPTQRLRAPNKIFWQAYHAM